MRKFGLCLLLIALVMGCLAGCNSGVFPVETAPATSAATEEVSDEVLTTKEVHITAGKIESGMTAKDVFVEVTIDGQPVSCRVQLTGFAWDGYWEMGDDEPVPEDFCVRLDIFYSLPKGYDVENINVTMECEGGEFDGTGSISFDENGNVEAWSRAFYGEIQPEVYPVNIKVVEFAPGMTVNQVKVEVTVDGNPVEARVEATLHSNDGMRELDNTEKIPEYSRVRLNIYYWLDYGIDIDKIEVTMDFAGGEYDGTSTNQIDADGRIEAWSHAFYGENAASTEVTTVVTEATTAPTEATTTKPTEATTVPTEATTTKPTEATTAPTEATTTKPTEATTVPTEATTTKPTETTTQPTEHTHTWKELPGPGIVDCTIDGVKNFECSCGETKTEIIPAPGHDLRNWSVNSPTCTEDGRKTTSCKRCGAGFVVELPALGHDWTEWEYKTGRVHSHTCTVCGVEEEKNHNIPSGTVICTDCGEAIIN